MPHQAAVNIVLKIKSAYKKDFYQSILRGEVLSPPFMAGRYLEIQYTHARGAYLSDQIESNPVGNQHRARSDAVSDVAEEPLNWQKQHSIEDEVTAIDALVTSLSRPGTMALFYACEKTNDDDDDYWVSRFVDVIGMPPDRAVTHGLCRVTTKRGEDIGQKNKAHVDILYPQNARTIKSKSDLVGFFEDYLIPEIDGLENNANCLLRVISPKTKEVILAWVYVARKVVKKPSTDGRRALVFSLPADLSVTWKDAVIDGMQSDGLPRVIASAVGVDVGPMSYAHVGLSKEISAGLKSGEIFIEALPGQRMRVIGHSLEKLFQKGSRLDFAASSCVYVDESGEESLRFIPMTMGLVISRPGDRNAAVMQSRAAVVAKLAPDVQYTHFKTREIQTANFAGVNGKTVLLSPDDYIEDTSPGFRGPMDRGM